MICAFGEKLPRDFIANTAVRFVCWLVILLEEMILKLSLPPVTKAISFASVAMVDSRIRKRDKDDW